MRGATRLFVNGEYFTTPVLRLLTRVIERQKDKAEKLVEGGIKRNEVYKKLMHSAREYHPRHDHKRRPKQ